MKKDEIVQNEFSGEIYIIETNDKLPDNRKYPLALIQAAQNQKQTNTRGLGFGKVAEVQNRCKSNVNS